MSNPLPMSTLKPDASKTASEADRTRTTLPWNSEKVAVATVLHQLIGDKETYWLSPSGDGQSDYELWSENDLLPGRLTCSVWLENCEGITVEQAAEQLLEALWMRRHPIACLVSFSEAGLVSMRRLKKLVRDYDKRLKPTKAPKLAWPVHGEQHYNNGALKYRGKLRGKVPHGEGTGYWENGEVWCEGLFENGKPHGHCRVYFSDGGLRHEGTFLEGLPNGPGKECRQDGTPWFDGVFGKQGPYYSYGARIWVEGRLYDKEGNLSYEGKFVSDGKHSKPAGGDDPARERSHN